MLCEFRVFNGDQDVTSAASLRVYASGSRDHEITVETSSDSRLRISLSPAIYDVEAFGREDGSIVNVKWTERIVVTHYPDEPDGHLEVINFRPRFGAMQFVSLRDDPARDFDIQVFPAGAAAGTSGSNVDLAAREPAPDSLYQLFVLPSGRYDIRIRRRSGSDSGSANSDERWLRGLQVTANRTQLTTIDGLPNAR